MQIPQPKLKTPTLASLVRASVRKIPHHVNQIQNLTTTAAVMTA
jgi:hypothetical protein